MNLQGGFIVGRVKKANLRLFMGLENRKRKVRGKLKF